MFQADMSFVFQPFLEKSAEYNGNYPKRLPSRSLFGEKIKRVQLTFSYLAMPINFKYVQFQDILPPV